MKKMKWIAVLSALVLAASAQVAPAQDTPPAPAPAPAPVAAPAAPAVPQPPAAPEIDMVKLSQFIGTMEGKRLAEGLELSGIEIDKAAFSTAFNAALNGETATLNEDEMKQVQMSLQAGLPALQKKAADKNLAAGDAFLVENAKKEGVKITTSGLQYKVITEGTGAIPTATDRVSVNYKGTLTNGREFDSSYKSGKPAEFTVGGVIPGWTEALQIMKEGGKLEIYVPSKLAYGERGQRGIPPHSALVFEVELLKILPKQEEPQGIELSPQGPQGAPQDVKPQ